MTQVYQVLFFNSVIQFESSHLVYLELESSAVAHRNAHTSRIDTQADPSQRVVTVVVVLYHRSQIFNAVGVADCENVTSHSQAGLPSSNNNVPRIVSADPFHKI